MLTKRGVRPSLVSRRVQRILLIVWCCFIVYGSFIPFRINTDPEFARSRLAQVQLFPFQDGKKNFSLPDVASNILLFIPFGFLLSVVSGRSSAGRIGASGVLALIFATTIEIGQLFAPGRTSSGIDVEAGVIGALLGATAACLLQRFDAWVDTGVQLARDEPLLTPLVLVALWLCSDAFYPFAVTFDVSTAAHNLKNARWIPFHGSERFWLDRVVDEAVIFAMLTALGGSALQRHVSRATAAITAASAAVAFSGMLETGKLFFVGRSPNVENVLLASIGAVIGATVIPLLVERWPIKRHPEGALAVLALALLVYSELTPFAFALSSAAIAARLGRIEWIPFLAYYGADPQSALFDLWKKLLLSGFWGFAFARVRGATPLGAAGAGLFVGALLEAAQILTVGRMAAVSDVLTFGLGAWIGGAIQLTTSPGPAARL